MKDDAIVLRPDDAVEQEEWYSALVEECKAIITEAVFTSRWALVEGYHALGERVNKDKDFQKAAKGNTLLCHGVAKNIGISDHTLYRARQFAETYRLVGSDTEDSRLLLPGGKNMSWHKVCNELLPAHKENMIEVDPPEGLYNVIVIDPAISHVSDKVDPNSSTHVRHVMDALSDLARETGIALVASA